MDWPAIVTYIIAGIVAVWALVQFLAKKIIPRYVFQSVKDRTTMLEAEIRDSQDRRDFQQELLLKQQQFYKDQAEHTLRLLETDQQFIHGVVYNKLETIEAKVGTNEMSIAMFRDEFALLIKEIKKASENLKKVNEETAGNGIDQN